MESKLIYNIAMDSRDKNIDMIHRQCAEHTREEVERVFDECKECIDTTIDKLWNNPVPVLKPMNEWDERREICIAYEKAMHEHMKNKKK